MLGSSFAESFGDFAAVDFGGLLVGKDGDNERAVEVFVTCLFVEAQVLETGAEFGSLFDLFGGETKAKASVGKAELKFLDQVLVVESAFVEIVTGGFVFGKEKTLVVVVHHFVQKFSVGGLGVEEAVEGSGLFGFGGDGGATIQQLEGMAEGEAVDALHKLDGVSCCAAAETVEESFAGSDNEVGSVLVVVEGTEADEVFGTVFFEFDASGTDKSDKIHLFFEAADFRFRDSGHEKCQFSFYFSKMVDFSSISKSFLPDRCISLPCFPKNQRPKLI